MIFQIFDTGINRLLGVYDNEAAALAMVRALLDANGDAYAEDLSVGCEEADGTFVGAIAGDELVERANEVAAEQARTESRQGEAVASRG